MTIIAVDYKAMNQALTKQGFFWSPICHGAFNSDPARHAGGED